MFDSRHTERCAQETDGALEPMSNLFSSPEHTHGRDNRRAGEASPGSDTTIQTLLGVLNDADARAILEATVDGSKSAAELSEACEIPLSTTYRKVDSLTQAGLLDEHLDVHTSGNHIRKYTLRLDSIHLSITDEEFEYELAHGD